MVMMSSMLKCNISIIAHDEIWNCDDQSTDIAFVYVGGNKCIPTEVSTSMLRLTNFLFKHGFVLFSQNV